MLALTVPAALVGLSSCSTVPAWAATVNGTTISRSDFQRDLEALAANPGLLNLTGGTDVSIDGPTARSWLSQVITWKTAEDLLSQHGLSTTQESIDAVQAQIVGNPTAAELPQSMQDEVVAGAVAVQSLSQLTAPSAEDLEAQYRDDPAGTGALCVSHILVETEAEAEAVVDELRGGADFAEVAKARSTEPAAATTGGAAPAGADGNACQSVGAFQTQYDADFTAGVLGATVGVPTDPIKSQFGWHVILLRPYEEVADDLATLVASSPGEAARTGALATADITVDRRYGQWSRVAGNVVSLALTGDGAEGRGRRAGPAGPDLITSGVLDELARPVRRFLRTVRHPSATVVEDATTFDHLYEQADTFTDVYQAITDALVQAAHEDGEVVYAVPGSPYVLERSVRHLLADPRVDVRVVPGLSFLDLAYGRLGIDPIEAGVRLVDGHEFATAAAGERGPMLVAHARTCRGSSRTSSWPSTVRARTRSSCSSASACPTRRC